MNGFVDYKENPFPDYLPKRWRNFLRRRARRSDRAKVCGKDFRLTTKKPIFPWWNHGNQRPLQKNSMENPFSQQMSQLPDLRLVKIVEYASQYEAAAVEAARAELARRCLEQWQLEELKAILRQEAARKQSSKDLQDRVEREMLVQARSAGKLLNPFTESRSLTITRLLSLYLLASWSYFLLKEWSLITFLVSVPPATWDFLVLWVIITLILLPVTAVLLWRTAIQGWILATAYFLQACIGAGLSVYWNWHSMAFTSFREFFPETQVYFSVIQFFLNLAVLLYLNRPGVRALFAMDRHRWLRSLAIALAICLPLGLILIQ